MTKCGGTLRAAANHGTMHSAGRERRTEIALVWELLRICEAPRGPAAYSCLSQPWRITERAARQPLVGGNVLTSLRHWFRQERGENECNRDSNGYPRECTRRCSIHPV